MLWVVGLTLVLQVALVELSFTRALFKLAPLTAWQLALTCGLGLVVVTLIELAKLALEARRRRSAHHTPPGTTPSQATSKPTSDQVA